QARRGNGCRPVIQPVMRPTAPIAPPRVLAAPAQPLPLLLPAPPLSACAAACRERHLPERCPSGSVLARRKDSARPPQPPLQRHSARGGLAAAKRGAGWRL